MISNFMWLNKNLASNLSVNNSIPKIWNKNEIEIDDTRLFIIGNLLSFLLSLILLVQLFVLFINRSSHQSCSITKAVLRNFTKFTGKHLCRSLFFNRCMPQACNFIKKEALTQVFSCGFCEIFKNTFLTEQIRATTFVANPSFDQVILEMSCFVCIIHIYFDINSSFVSYKLITSINTQPKIQQKKVFLLLSCHNIFLTKLFMFIF